MCTRHRRAPARELKDWSRFKTSTFFPKQWSKQKIAKVIEEASMNIYFKDGNLYRGITKSGIKIEMRINQANKEINTAYIIF
ncbi:EndoU domain-containing protein [Olleya sp. R77988]|uniref:EndoU domain-containing protein n=1 Tax=Olleya sp. R77988 TaxID=3093875 RepID=UPI0037C60052